MKQLFSCYVAAFFSVLAGSAYATDSIDFFSHSSAYNWTGFYGGFTAGAAFGQYDPRTSTTADGYIGAVGAAAVTAAGAQTINSTGFVAGIEGGYNWQIGNVLLGIEADVQAADLYGSAGSGAIPYPLKPGQYTITSFGQTDWVATVRPRVGYVAPNHWLFYATGGLALTQLQSDLSFVDTHGVLESGRLDAVKAGYAVGGGIEAPLTGRLSVKAEYLYVDFASTPASVTANTLVTHFPGQVFSHSSDFKADIVRAGLNYRFGGDDPPAADHFVLPFKAPAWPAQSPLFAGWQIETGARLWLGSGSIGAPQPLLNSPPLILASRLIYSNLDAIAGETFARVDHSSGFFIKGNLGAGGITGGQLNDEDFPAFVVYSNTFSSASGHLGYATVDVGYDIWQTPGGARVGPFVGYNYYTQSVNTYGCTQVAGDAVCSPTLGPSLLTLTENDTFNSLRIGLSSEVMLTDRLRLTVDAAYVPVVGFSGLDNHLLRQLLLPEAANSGNGVMLEAMLDYYVTNAWSIGVGARYWAWNMNTGMETFDFLAAAVTLTEPARFTTERYGAFVQSSYRFGDPPASSRDPQTLLVKAPAPMAPVDWTGFYAGAHFGGGFSNGQWSDPFGSTVGPLGFTNVAGFGDNTHATGPLGGGEIGVNWQTGRLVLGAGVDASAANFRGENTCFSGLGGIDCQHVVNSLVTFTGRAGFAFDRSLVYVKGGGALTNTSYTLFGDTNALTLGTGTTTLGTWGWTVGGGIEYGLTNHWTVFAEYDYIGLPTVTVPFPSVAVIDTQTISVKQSVDVFKLGMNYKFELPAHVPINWPAWML